MLGTGFSTPGSRDSRFHPGPCDGVCVCVHTETFWSPFVFPYDATLHSSGRTTLFPTLANEAVEVRSKGFDT